jgi:hypothetical protein
LTKIKIIKNAGNRFVQRFLKNGLYSSETSAYLASQKAHWLEDREEQIGILTKEFGNLKILIVDDYEFFDSTNSDLFEVLI